MTVTTVQEETKQPEEEKGAEEKKTTEEKKDTEEKKESEEEKESDEKKTKVTRSLKFLREFIGEELWNAHLTLHGPINWKMWRGIVLIPQSLGEMGTTIGALACRTKIYHYGSYELQILLHSLNCAPISSRTLEKILHDAKLEIERRHCDPKLFTKIESVIKQRSTMMIRCEGQLEPRFHSFYSGY